MGLETGNTIASLNASWPLGSDPKSEGDDHIRLIKDVLKYDVLSRTAGGTVTEKVTFNAGISAVGLSPDSVSAIKTRAPQPNNTNFGLHVVGQDFSEKVLATRGDGFLQSETTHGKTTTGGSNLVIDSFGLIYRSTAVTVTADAMRPVLAALVASGFLNQDAVDTFEAALAPEVSPDVMV